MPAPPRGAFVARLRTERLEDRLAPAVGFDPDRVLVSFTDPGPAADHLAELDRSPVADGATPIAPGVYAVDLADGATVTAAVRQLDQLPGAVAQPDYAVAPART